MCINVPFRSYGANRVLVAAKAALRLCGECFETIIHRKDAEVAETTQRRTRIGTLAARSP